MATPRIVVADDHDKSRVAIASLLASDFDVVATVADGQAAVEAAGALYPDLVVLDISMPGLNGFEAGALIRELPDAGSSLPPRPTTRPSPAPRPRWALRASCGSENADGTRASSPPGAVVPRVCFYEDGPSLARAVAPFIGEGLMANQAAVIVATASHGASIRAELTAMGVNSENKSTRAAS